MPPPRWAQNLLTRVWTDEGRGLEDRPPLVWRWTSYQHTSGRACVRCGRILVSAGTDRADARLVLLHECAHVLTGQGHTAAFWDKVWALYRRYKVPLGYALEREGGYRKGARTAYARSRSRR